MRQQSGATYRNSELNTEKLKDAAFMNTVRWKLTQLTGAEHTFGCITKMNRISLGMDKSHVNDAFVIAGGVEQIRTSPFVVKQRRRNNRSLQTDRKGFKPSIRRKRYGLQSGDTVFYMGKRIRISGSFSYGRYVWKEVEEKGQKRGYLKAADVVLVRYGRGISFE